MDVGNDYLAFTVVSPDQDMTTILYRNKRQGQKTWNF